MRVLPHLVAAILAALPVHAAQPDLSLDQLMATLHTMRHVEARYIERRYLHALRMPLEVRGTLRFNAPDHLEKLSDGSADRLTINGNQLTINRGSAAAPVVIMLNEHPEVGVLIDSIRAILSGDGAALRRIFDITLSGTINEWQLLLQPHDARQRDILQWMRISGYAERITAIDTRDGEGDRSEMSIVELPP